MSADGPARKRVEVADYFVVVGLGDSIKRYDAEGEAAENRTDGVAPSRPQDASLEQLELPAAADPITDVAVVFLAAGEEIPAGFACVSLTPGRHCANLNHGSSNSSKAVYLCYRRGRDKAPLTDIDVVYKSNNHFDYELLEHSISGQHSGDVNHSSASSATFFCYHRARRSGMHFYGMAITDLSLINVSKNETPPRGFVKVSRVIHAGLTGPSFCLVYKKSLVKPHAISYRAGILSRFPATDHEDFPLPESVPLFCLPLGASVESWSDDTDYPLPTFSSFVLTGSDGEKVYGSAVSFYEELPKEKQTDQMRASLFGKEQEQVKQKIFCSKSICLLSHFPSFGAFKTFLSSLYRISISGESSIPLERYISNFMLDVPFPSPTRPRVLLQLGHESIVLSQPVKTSLPMSGTSHTILLRCLSPENLVTLLTLMLLEHKILLHSVRPSLLTSFGEAICSVLFPLSWQCPYIPLCPLALASFIHAPMPFLIGIDSRYFDLYDTPADCCCVNLDNNTLAHPETSKGLSSSILPKKAVVHLLKTLKALQIQIPLGTDLDGDLAVTVAPLRFNPDQQETGASDVAVREAFLRFFALMLVGYRLFLRPLTKAPSEAATDISQLFDMKGFLKSKPSQEHNFFSKFFDTQLFAKLIEERSFVSVRDAGLAFFDECTEEADKPQSLVTISKESERMMTVVVSPPDIANLEEGRMYSYPTFTLDESLFSRDKKRSPMCSPAPSPIHRRTRAERGKSVRNAQNHLSHAQQWSRFLLSHVYALWFIHLPAFAQLHAFKREALNLAFKILHQIEEKGLQAPDEVCYRVLMDLCGRLGHPALAVRVLMEMRRLKLQPNAITYALYNKAVLESPWPSCTAHWRLLRHVLIATIQLRVRLRERRAIQASAAALAAADSSRIKAVRAKLRHADVTPSFRSKSSSEISPRHALFTNTIPCTVGSLPNSLRGSSVADNQSITSVDESTEVSFDRISLGSTSSLQRAGDSTPSIPSHVHKTIGESSSQGRSPSMNNYFTGSESSSIASCGSFEDLKSDRVAVFVPSSPKGMRHSTASSRNSYRGHRRGKSDTVMSIFQATPHAAMRPSRGDVDAVVTVSSCVRCHHCYSLLFDEQVMAGWKADDSDFNTRCEYCEEHFVAFLTITVCVVQEGAPALPSSEGASPQHGSNAHLIKKTNLSVPYLSPFLLRKEVETLLSNNGEDIMWKVAFVDQHPIIYWNLVWYFERLKLPSRLSTLFMTSHIAQTHTLSGDVVVRTVWHQEHFDDGSPALYQRWLHRGSASPSTVMESMANSTSSGSLQSLAARIQCGDYYTPLSTMLKDRVSAHRTNQGHADNSQKSNEQTAFRGVYWELLCFLAMVQGPRLDTVKFDKDFSRAISRLPRDLSAEMRRDDSAPSPAAHHFRKTFGALGV